MVQRVQSENHTYTKNTIPTTSTSDDTSNNTTSTSHLKVMVDIVMREGAILSNRFHLKDDYYDCIYYYGMSCSSMITIMKVTSMMTNSTLVHIVNIC